MKQDLLRLPFNPLTFMIIRRESESIYDFEVRQHLYDHLFFQTYLVFNPNNAETYYLVEWDKASSPPSFHEEMSLWLSSKAPFPRITKQWNHPEQPAVLVPHFQGISILNWTSLGTGQLSDTETTSLFFDLAKIFQEAYQCQIKVVDSASFAPKIYQTLTCTLTLLPVPLLALFQLESEPLLPLKKNAVAVPAIDYIRALGEVFFCLLAGRFPERNERLEGLTTLGSQKESVIQGALSGQIESFEGLVAVLEGISSRPDLKRMFPSAEKRDHPKPIEMELLSGLPRKTANLGRSMAKASKMLLAIVGSYYLKKGGSLATQGWRVLSKPSMFSLESLRKPFEKIWWRALLTSRGPLDSAEFFRFTYSLSVMLDTGITLSDALQALFNQTQDARLKERIKRVRSEIIGKGLSLSMAMAKQPDVFPEAYVNMIKAGEASGKLAPVLQEIARYLERSLKLRQKVKSASTYPIFVASVCFIMVFFFFYLALPRILEMALGGSGVSYPLPTRVLIELVSFVHSRAFLLFLLLLAAVYFPVHAFYRSLEGRRAADGLKIEIPIFGPVYKKVLLTEFCSTLGSMLHSGVNFLEALSVAGKVSGNVVFNQIVLTMKARLIRGVSLTGIMESIPFYPFLIRSMVSVGETTGSLGNMLIKAGEMYESEVDYSVQKLFDLIEPFLVITMGVVVGFVVVAIFLPVYSVVSSISP